MKLAVAYSDQEVETLGVSKSQNFGFSKDAEEMIFTMFTKNIYSNPIGSVVREITSNCFDSHKEANVSDPVIVKLTKENNQHYISFIDVGVGMSPERISKVYAQYFNSTKRNDNNQIGGFGIGGKTPLAYAESFFLITTFNGFTYTYSIRKGTKSPVLDQLDRTKTGERNGTTVKIPVKSQDVPVFEREINRQLYYFENVIFEGFSPNVKNDYQIIEGKNFLYRGTNQYSYTHICLGRVAYPIDFDVLDTDGSDSWYAGNWDVPVALKLEIGDVNVTVSREAIDYTEETKKLIKKKLKAVKQEMADMLKEQHAKLDSLEDFYRMEGDPYTLLMSNKDAINISSFATGLRINYAKLNALNIPSQLEIIHKFYNVSMFGKKKRRESTWDKGLRTIAKENVFLVINDDMPRKKNAYMKHTFGHFYTIKKKDFTYSDVKYLIEKLTPNNYEGDTKIIFNQFRELQKEACALVEKLVKRYSSITVPDGFTVSSGRSYNPNQEIPLTFDTKYGFTKERIKMADLQKCKATLYYGELCDEDQMHYLKNAYEKLFEPKSEGKFSLGYYDQAYPVRFVMTAKNNLKYISELTNAKPFTEFHKVLVRKREAVVKSIEAIKFRDHYNTLSKLFMNHSLFNVIDSEYAKTVAELLNLNVKYDRVKKFGVDVHEGSRLLQILDISREAIEYNGVDLMEIVEKTTEKNGMLRYVRIYDSFDPTSKYHSKEEIDNILQLLTLAYVK